MADPVNANGEQSIAAMHCSVMLLHGGFPGAGAFAISMQSMPAIDACIDADVARVGTIAIAVA